MMALMGSEGLLVYTVFFSAWVLYVSKSGQGARVIWQYGFLPPKMVSSGQGARVIRQYGFLFQRSQISKDVQPESVPKLLIAGNVVPHNGRRCAPAFLQEVQISGCLVDGHEVLFLLEQLTWHPHR